MINRKFESHEVIPVVREELSTAFTAKLLNRRPKWLFLAFYFPPVRAIGCVRAWNIATYLARAGWEVTVVTPDPSVWRQVEDVEKVTAEAKKHGIRRILTGHRWRCLSPDEWTCGTLGRGRVVGGACRRLARYFAVDINIGWLRAVKQACSNLSAKDVDVILATGTPFLSFRLARYLSHKLARPYVLDYRDPWTGNPHPDTLTPPAAITARKEAMLLADCAAATIVSRSWGSAMADRFDLGTRLHVITNGYDPEEMAGVKPHNFGHFAIVYTGGFYPPKRVITPVMAALRRVTEVTRGHTAKWYFHYYGDYESYVREEADRFGLLEQVVLHGRVSRAEALSAVGGANVSVVIASVFADAAQEDKGIVTGKLFESLGLGTPVLMIAPCGSDATEIVEETGIGRAFVGTDIEGIARFVFSMLSREKKNLTCTDRYSWPYLAAKFDKVLRGVMPSPRNLK